MEVSRVQGRAAVWIVETVQGPKKAAVMSIAHEELNNWQAVYGDAISIDGMMIQNRLDWTTIGFTMLNNEHGMTSGGICQTAFETKEFFHWLFEQLFGYVIFLEENEPGALPGCSAASTRLAVLRCRRRAFG